MGNRHERALNLTIFPSARAPRRDSSPEPDSTGSADGTMKEKLLVLDHELLILKSLQELFQDDYEVYTTDEAEQGLLLAGEHDFAVILCDESLPGVPGHEFLRRVREISNAARVLMSEFADFVALTEAVNSGQIFSYIAKPWEPPKLKARIKAAAAHFKLVQEAEQGRELLGALMEKSPDLIFFKDSNSRFTRVNHSLAEFVGAKSPAECIGKRDADYFEADDARRWSGEEQKILRSGHSQIDQIERFKRPNDGLCWLSTTKVPMFDHAGEVSGIAGISRDITALKASEEMLREQSEHNRMILETANDAFIGMEPNGTITAWNPQAERTFGWTAAEAIGRTLCDTVVAPAYRYAHANGVEQFLTTPQGSLLNRPIDLIGLHRDGHEFPAEATVWSVRVGGIYSFNAFIRDVSERLLAEDARKKESTLVQLLHSVTVAANRSSSIEHTAQTCLRLICLYTGWQVGHVYLKSKDSSGDLISLNIWCGDGGERFAAFREATSRAWSSATGLPGYILASGRPEWMTNLADCAPPQDQRLSGQSMSDQPMFDQSMSDRNSAALKAGLRSGFGFPILVEEEIIGILEFYSLYTAQLDEELLNMVGHIGSQLGQVIRRQRAEEELRRAKASAESANRAKSDFLTTMSHEMRTPMNAILGMADLLSESSLHDEQRGYVEIFQKAGASLLALINDILDLAKVESGRFELESIDFDLRALLEKIIEMMIPRAQDRGLHLNLEILTDVPSDLVGDPNRLRQILLNLIGNALKFTEQGSVTLRVERDSGGAPGRLRFNVIDTGIGIAAEQSEMIFERFTQADSSTTRQYGGTGLGLAISKGFAELMGGELGCVSELGKGSTFYLAVPFAIRDETTKRPDSVAPQATIVQPEKTGARTGITSVLLAEDSEYNVLLIQAYLKNSGIYLDVAENGKIAVEKVISNRPDLILMDLQMPVMDGLEATRAIRQAEERTGLRPIPILALTADAGQEAVSRSLFAGCSEHLSKPIKRATLLDAIARHIHGIIRVTPPEGIEGLVPNYLASIRRDMETMMSAIGEQDCEIAGRLGHQFKGTGHGYGFPEIAQAGTAIELAARSANENEIRRQILSLAAYLDRVEVVV
jgi:PAS domain S-box-containing protein